MFDKCSEFHFSSIIKIHQPLYIKRKETGFLAQNDVCESEKLSQSFN